VCLDSLAASDDLFVHTTKLPANTTRAAKLVERYVLV
jgi:hypothetical protein